MAHYEFNCEDCTIGTTASRKDARLCPSCRVCRNLRWARAKYARVRQCRSCGGQYRPYHGRDLSLCAACLIEVKPQKHRIVHCVICNTEAPGPAPRVPLCLTCLKSPTRQQDVMQALNKGFRDRQALALAPCLP